MSTITPGGLLNSVPAPVKQTTAGSFLDIRSSGWAQQYLPELMDAEAEVFGNRTISGLLSRMGAEEAMASDQVVWSEQGRLHIDVSGNMAFSGAGANLVATVTTAAATGVRVGDVVVIHQAAKGELKCYVTATASDTTYAIVPYAKATVNTAGGVVMVAGAVKGFVFGSEYKKGTGAPASAITPSFKSFENRPVIMKDLYEINGSDASQIGWVEVSGEDGQNGYLWYLKAEGDTNARFNDYLEMMCVESELNASVTTTGTANTVFDELGVRSGTEGLFAAVKSRGNSIDGVAADSNADALAAFDLILKEFDKQGAIEENMLMVNRKLSLKFDDMLSEVGPNATGSGFGLFNNSESMALNLGFTGFRRGTYDFYKSDWKYLNDITLRGNFGDGTGAIEGLMIPAGTSNVYDQGMGKNIRRPFLHVRYRASQTESRKLKTWITGSVGATTSQLDVMEVNYLSERCLVTQGANNFMLFTR